MTAREIVERSRDVAEIAVLGSAALVLLGVAVAAGGALLLLEKLAGNP
jgi:hypothetical protein